MQNESLNREQICASIEQTQLEQLKGLEILEVVDSTNTHMLSLAKQGMPSGTVCLAEQQTAGRGRLGREWYSPFGANIYCSLLWRFNPERADISNLSIAVAVMVLNALRQYGITQGLQLKWPNDIWFAERKLAGILLERSDASHVVIGIGINLDVSAAAQPEWIDVHEITGCAVRRNHLVGLLLNQLLLQLPRYVAEGLQPFWNDWRHHDVLLDKPIMINGGGQQQIGIACGINHLGELLLQNQSGEIEALRCGEVSARLVEETQ